MDNTSRTSRIVRRKQGIVLVERDLKILNTVARFGLTSSRHLTDLYFNGVANTAHKRLRALFNAGNLQTHLLLGSAAPTLYTLTPQGQKALKEHNPSMGELPPIPRSLDVADLKHRLAIIDFRVALILAIRQMPGVRLLHFLSGAEAIAQAKAAGLAMLPDAFVLLEKQGDQILFQLEMDLGTESLPVWAQKAKAYSEALLRKRLILGQSAWQAVIVAPGARRLQAIANAFATHGHCVSSLFIDLSTLTQKTFLEPRFGLAPISIPKAPPLLTENGNENAL